MTRIFYEINFFSRVGLSRLDISSQVEVSFYGGAVFSRISLGFNNLTNQEPPEDPTQSNWPWFSNSGRFYNAIGQEIYLQFDMSF